MNTRGCVLYLWIIIQDSYEKKVVMVINSTNINKGNAKRGISPHLTIWPGGLWPMTLKINRVQILLRTKHVPSLVKIHWRMLILECSQGCYRRKDGQTVTLLYPFATSLAKGKQNEQWPLILTALTEYKKNHDIWRQKSRLKKMTGVKAVNRIPFWVIFLSFFFFSKS